MDTLFRLVSLHSSSNHHHQQQQSSNSFNSSKTSTSSSRSSKQATNNKNKNCFLHHSSFSQEEEEDQEECFNHHHQNYQNHLYMDEDFSSSSSNPNPNPSNINIQDFSNLNINDLLLECARSVAANDTPRVQHLMWMLNELSSPYGDTQQKIAYYFLQALFARLTSSGPRTLRTLSSASDRTVSFDSTRRVALKFQELSPWSSFGHVAANGVILESFLDNRASPAQQLHIIDFSNTFCTQWPTLLEALATRSTEDTPHLTITTVVSYPQRVMKEIAARMEKFARLMGVPFKFNVIHHSGDLSNLDLDRMSLGMETLLAVNCINALRAVPPAGGLRDAFLARILRLQPRIVTIIEEEADLIDTSGLDEEEMFLKGFRESLNFFSAYFDSLEESFPKTSNERLTLERAAGRAVVDLISCPVDTSTERRETARNWAMRMASLGFAAAGFSDDVADDVRALLRRYREGWAMTTSAVEPGGMVLTWKEQPVVWASAWRM